MSDEKRLTVKEQKFVAAITSGNAHTAQEAVYMAGYKPGSVVNADNMAAQILKRPHIQKAMSESIQRKFPNLTDLGADVLYNILNNPHEASTTKLKALDYLMKLFGWQAPSRSQHITAQVDAKDIAALPGEEEDPSEGNS